MNLFQIKSNAAQISPFDDFTSLFFPKICLACSTGLVRGEDVLCTKCILNFPYSNYQFRGENPIGEKFFGRLPIKYAGSLFKFQKSGMVQHLVHQLKYKNHPEIGVKLGKILGAQIHKIGLDKEFDLIVPLPLYHSRKMKRGYNQSMKFGEGLSESLTIPCEDNLVERVRNTSTQTKRNRADRWENVNDAFRVINQKRVSGKRILLVDDIMTTGSTIEACGTEIIKSGCSELSLAFIANA